MKNIILYGTGIDGERFWVQFQNKYNINFCIDKRNNRLFHGIPVYSLDEKQKEIQKYLIVVAVSDYTYPIIKKNLEKRGLVEWTNFINANAFEKELAVLYGNCHIRVLCEYLRKNYYFNKKYHICFHYVAEKDYPSNEELKICNLLIVQDIKNNNEFDMPGADELIKRLKKGKKIIIPNLYGCNLFYPQCYNPEDENLKRHLDDKGIDVKAYDFISAQRIRVAVEGIGKRDKFIDECCAKDIDTKHIENAILEKNVFSKEEILDNFTRELEKLKSREKNCDIMISDYIHENYQTKQLFYEPLHPTEAIIEEKGKRILNLLQMPVDEAIQMQRTLDAMEMPIYGCVKRALNLKFNQNIMRRNSSSTLKRSPETLREYVINYCTWVWDRRE